MKLGRLLCGLFLVVNAAFAADAPALKGAVILLIRHAEKPESGEGLSLVGMARATNYVNYFRNYAVDSNSLTLNYLVATADSKKSHRPRLTIEPLSQAIHLPIDCRFANKQFQELADEIQSKPRGNHILISWHHGEIPNLLQALGADPSQLLPESKWPDPVFGWVIQLRYDDKGRLLEARRFNQKLMPGDTETESIAGTSK